MNVKKQYSIREFGVPSVFSGTNMLTIKDNMWYINGQLTNKSTSDIEPNINNELGFFVREGDDTDNYVFQKNLELLNQRINAIHKELTYWDLYKLTASVDNEEDLDSIFSALSVGQSLVINCPTFTKGDITYSKGDVIVRTSENQEIKIDALATGLFYPSKTSSAGGNVYVLTYSYFNGEIAKAGEPGYSQEVSLGNSVTPTSSGKIPGEINFTGLTDVAGSIYGHIYNLTNETNPITFPIIYENGNSSNLVVRPIIKMFTADHEELSTDSLTISISGSNWSITWPSALTAVAPFLQVK